MPTHMKIDNTSSEHAYLQLAGLLRKRIESGEIAARLPSLTDLTAQTHLAVGTVRRAIEILERERLVRRVPGRGTFVTDAAEWQLPEVTESTG
jgi:GntR family transcriptional regulator